MAGVIRDASGRTRVIERPVASGNILFQGPLGLWPWPLLNLILSVTSQLKGQSSQGSTPFQQVATRRTEYIRDGTGRIIEKFEEVAFG